jgi:glycosyltransferase involved in cell wall biosynthesis
MHANPRVSVVLTYFNYRDFLPAAIASVKAQTYANLELIVVDDCAPEAMPGIEQFADGGFTSKVVRHDYNQGLPVARNSGVAHATGELLVIMDSDDLLERTFVERTVRTLLDCAVDGVYTHVQTFGDRNYLWTPDCSLFNLLVGNPGPATFLMKREVFDAVGGYKSHLPLNSDHDFWISAVAHGFQFARLDEPLYLYRKHAQSLSAIHRQARWSAVPTLYDEHKELYDKHAKDLLTLREMQYRQLEYEYDRVWQGWHRADEESRLVHQRYEEAQNRIRFANLILENAAFRGLLWAYRTLRNWTSSSRGGRSRPSVRAEHVVDAIS